MSRAGGPAFELFAEVRRVKRQSGAPIATGRTGEPA